MRFSARARRTTLSALGLPIYGWLLLVCLGLLAAGSVAVAEEEKPEDPVPDPDWVNIKNGLHSQGISSLRIHPKLGNVMYANVHGMGAAQSTDGGKTWERITEGVKPEPGPRSKIRITLDPSKPRWLYLVVDGQVYVSKDGSKTWSNITTGALASYTWDRKDTDNLVWEVRVNPAKSLHLLLGTLSDGLHHGGLYESTDGGVNWEQVAGSNLSRTGLGEAGHDTFRVRVDPKTQKHVMLAGHEHVWSSDDRGRSFSLADPGGPGVHDIRHLVVSSTGKDIYVADETGIWRMKGFNKKWGKAPEVQGDVSGVFLSPTSKKTLIAFFRDRGLQVSSDSRHKKWAPLGGDDGYAHAEITDVVAHPKERGTIFFCSHSTGLHVSKDEGKTIEPITDSNIPSMVPELLDIGVHGGGDGVHLALTRYGVVFRSLDRGLSWGRAGRLAQAPHRVFPDVRADNARVWYATGRQLLRSSDDGSWWDVLYTPANPADRVVDVRQTTRDGKDLLVIALERGGVVLTSEDEGKTWVSTKPLPISDGTWVTSLAVNPTNADHMVLAAKTLRRVWSDKDTDGGVFQTLDGGKSWQDMAFNLKPGKRDDADTRRRKANWNRGRFVAFDMIANLVLYGADGGGLWARALPKVGDDKGDVKIDWFNVTPTVMPNSHMGAIANIVDGDPAVSTWVMQLSVPGSDEVEMATISGLDLRALYEQAAGGDEGDGDDDGGDDDGGDDEEKAPEPAWTTMKSPATALDTLHADAAVPGRFVGCDADGGGVYLYQVGGGDKPSGDTDEASDAPVEPDEPRQFDPPTGMQAFSASADQDIKVWTLLTAKQESPLRGHEGGIYAVALASDESMVASAGAGRKVRLWQRPELTAAAQIEAPGEVNCLVFDDDAEKLYAGCASWQILVIDKEQKQAVGMLEGHGGAVTALATSDDSAMLYSGSTDGKVKVWDVTQMSEVMEVDFGAEVFTLAVAPDGSRIFVGGANRIMKVFGADGTELGVWDSTQDSVVALALGPDGKRLFVGGVGGVDVLDAKDLTPITRLVGPEKAVLCLSVSVEGLWLFAGDAENGLWFWQTDTPKARWSNPGAHAGAVFSVAMTPDETELDIEPPAPANGGGDKPGGDGDKPGGDADKPGGDGDKPAGDGDKPAGAGDKPAGAGDKPEGTGDKPAGDGDKPAGDGDKPAGAGDKPAGDGDKPADDGKKEGSGSEAGKAAFHERGTR